ncbi:MAG: HAMP domain-containing protein [Alphaproteobacteria bacterium]|nr:HAMP domain-containing protein [Alphaproteobacteria bacterium]
MNALKKIGFSLNIGKQIYGLLLCFFCVIAYLSYAIYSEKKIAINFSSKEILGNNYIMGVQPLYYSLLKIKNGQERSIPDELLSTLDKAEQNFGESQEMATKDFYDQLKSDLEKINSNKSSAFEVQVEFTRSAVEKLNKLINKIGDSSNLILDPDLDSYYVMDIILLKIPSLLVTSFDLQEQVLKIIAKSDKTIPYEEKAALLVTKGAVKSFVDGLNASYASMLKASPDGVSRTNLEASYKSIKEAMDAFLNTVDRLITSEKVGQEDVARFMESYKKVELEYFEFWKKGCLDLDRLLSKRTAGFYSKMQQDFSIAFVLVILCLIGSYYIYRAINVPINHFVSVIQTVRQNNDYSKRIQNIPDTELGILANSFNTMLEQIDIGRKAEDEKRIKEQTALKDISGLIFEISQGNISKRISTDDKDGFVKEVGKSLNNVIDNIERFLADVSSVMKGVSRYNLAQTIDSEYQGDFNALKTDINNAIKSIAEIVKLLSQTTSQVAVTSSETSLAISQISDGAQTQISAIDNVVKQVTTTTKSNEEISENTGQASTMARESVKIALNGKEKMRIMVDVVNNIAENSAKINKITETIEKIANKTNLLSLNAAIEAARAGEHGKGFAVVADEVGKLASSAADSTQEISMLIQEATTEAYRAVESVNLISQDMEQIQKFIEKNDEIINKIASSIINQNISLVNIQGNMKDLQGVASNNAAASEEITSTAIDLAKISDVARKELNKFKV